MWRSGRAICPVDGWFEWSREGDKEIPWHIRAKFDVPLFLAALTNWRPYGQVPAGTGFVIVAAQAGGGLVDSRGRRPIVLSAAEANRWLDPELLPEQAGKLVRERRLGTDTFEWYRVGAGVNDPTINSARLINPVSDV